MAFLRTVVRSVVLVGLGAAWLQAQTTRARVVVAPQGRPRIAAIAPPPPPPRVVTHGPTVFSNNSVVVLPDGRLLVDLGNGYQQVESGCYYVYGYGCVSYGYPIGYYTPTYVAPVYVVPVYPSVVYPAPVYPAGGYGGCGAWGCVYPSFRPVRSTSIPLTGAVHAAPPRPELGRTLPPVRHARP